MKHGDEPLVLVTAFDPFGGRPDNPSSDLVNVLDLSGVPVSIQRVVLPTSYSRSWVELDRWISKLAPAGILMFGYSGRSPGLKVERCAYNARTAAAVDNDGVRSDALIEPGGPKRVCSSVPIAKVARGLATAGVESLVSDDPGRFICNFVYYNALRHFPGMPTLFVHVPDWQSRRDADSMVLGASTLLRTFCLHLQTETDGTPAARI